MKLEEFNEMHQTVLACREQLLVITQKLRVISHKMKFEPVLKEAAVGIDKSTDNLQKVIDDLYSALRYIELLDEFIRDLHGGI